METEEIPATMQDMLKEFTDLEHQRREVEDQLGRLDERRKQLEVALIEQFADSGTSSVRCNGLMVYLRTDSYVSKRGEFTMEDVCNRLRLNGLGYLVGESYNASSLKSKIKELLADGGDLPQTLADCLNVGETTKIATRRS